MFPLPNFRWNTRSPSLEARGFGGGGLGDEFAFDGAALGAAFAVADAFDGVAGAGAPVVAGGVGLVGLGAFPAGGGIGIGEGFGLVEARLAVAAAAVTAVALLDFGDLDMGFRQFVEEARGDGRLPEAVDAAVGDEPDVAAALGAGDADIGEAAFFLEAGAAAFVQRALVREEAFLPAGQEDGVEFEALGRVQRHDRDGVEVLVRSRHP